MKKNERKKFWLSQISQLLWLMPLVFIAIGACSLPKPYVGRMVNTHNGYWCHVNAKETPCKIKSGAFIFSFTVERSKEDDSYVVKGIMNPTGGELKSWDHIYKSDFVIILSNNSIVTDSIGFTPLGNDLSRPISFKRKFKSGPFDAITIIWECTVRG